MTIKQANPMRLLELAATRVSFPVAVLTVITEAVLLGWVFL